MEIYCVGGAVRDQLLGLPVADHDWVVVGATPEALTALGFRPVGKDFPVFLHPDTQEEYALARTERKVAAGYKGFVFHYAPDVTLEDDLRRRDLTINAIARAADGTLIDPLNGVADLRARIFRHTGDAFTEDPVRILRLARFAARFPDFSIAPETAALMRHMVDIGEVDHLVAERVWQEIARGLMENKPSRMFETLRACGALARLMPELDRLWGVPQRADYHPEVDTGVHVMMVVDEAARAGGSLAVRFAALTHDLGKGNTPADILPRHVGHEARSADLVEAMCARLRAPSEVRDLARIVAREHGLIPRAAELRPKTLLTLLERMDAFRRPARLDEVLAACEADARGRLGFEHRDYPQSERMRTALKAALGVDAGAVAAAAVASGLRGDAIGQRVHEARCRAIAHALNESHLPLSS
jgi:tRNA nucleotidyltransferase (CCA-adding enzyme)